MPDATIHHYFVDEAGDLACFDRKGRIIVGNEGVSSTFLVGAALIHDVDGLGHEVNAMRARILSDPYFADIPSIAPAAGKTARQFHAKDDTPEVRMEMFKLLWSRAGVEIYAAFRRKSALAAELQAHFRERGVKLGSEFVYEELVTSIFENRLHLAGANHIVFARRGKSDRNIALIRAIELAKMKFEMKWKKGIDRPTHVSSSTPSETTGLQIVDYYLWALQRLLERGEARYFNYLAPAFKVVLDRDDLRRKPYGEYYTASGNPLTPEKLMPVT